MPKPTFYRGLIPASSASKLAAVLSACLLVILTACGGSSSSTPTPTPTTQSSTVQVNMGDAPADWMLAFAMNITSMNLTGSNGSVGVVSASLPVEMIHRLGIMEPIAMVPVPQDTYNGATITIASCNVSYLDPNTKAMVQKTIQGPFTAKIDFTSPVTVGATPYAFNFDLDLEKSVTMDNSGNLSFSPTFQTSAGLQGAGAGNGSRNGGMQQMLGVVSNASATSFSIVPLQATNTFTFKVNSATQFQGKVSNMSMVATGMGVLVTASLQSDGTLLATRIRSRMNSGGIMGGGIITQVVGMPATQLTLVMQNGAGASLMTSYLSQPLTVNLTSSTEYEIDDDRVDLTGLPVTPAFDASHIYAGQSVLPISEATGIAVSGSAGSVGTITASDVRLQEQGFRGTTDVTITPGSSGSFVLTLLPGCAFTTLTGATTIQVYQQTATNVESATAIPAGTTLRVHGLLFQNAGQWVFVASTIAAS